MPRHDAQQLAFDIDGMIHAADVAATPPWAGPPLHFTADYFAPADLDAAFEHWVFLNGRLGSYSRSHMWHRSIAVVQGLELGEHALTLFTADLRCDPEHGGDEDGDCLCVGDLLTQAICEPCGWHSIADSENGTVECWHDHAIPGWRDLPVVPESIRVRNERGLTKPALAWIEEHYPTAAQTPGSPIITERRDRIGTRHVPGYSPWGGYDIADTAVRHAAPRPSGGGQALTL